MGSSFIALTAEGVLGRTGAAAGECVWNLASKGADVERGVVFLFGVCV